VIKLKLTRSQLEVLAKIFNPVSAESAVERSTKSFEVLCLASDLLLLEVAEKLVKKFFFALSDKNKLSLTYAQGTAFMIGIIKQERIEENGYIIPLLQEVKDTLHHQLFNYQRRFYDTTKTSGIAGYNSLNQNPHYQLTAATGDRADNA